MGAEKVLVEVILHVSLVCFVPVGVIDWLVDVGWLEAIKLYIFV